MMITCLAPPQPISGPPLHEFRRYHDDAQINFAIVNGEVRIAFYPENFVSLRINGDDFSLEPALDEVGDEGVAHFGRLA